MKKAEDIILEIAKKHLFLETLEKRGRDSLDFSDQYVENIKSALIEAFEEGKNGALN